MTATGVPSAAVEVGDTNDDATNDDATSVDDVPLLVTDVDVAVNDVDVVNIEAGVGVDKEELGEESGTTALLLRFVVVVVKIVVEL